MKLNVKIIGGKTVVSDGDGKVLDWVDQVYMTLGDAGSRPTLFLATFQFTVDLEFGPPPAAAVPILTNTLSPR